MKLIIPFIAALLAAQAAFAQPPKPEQAEPEQPKPEQADAVADVIARATATNAATGVPTPAATPIVTDGKAAFVSDAQVRPDGSRTESDNAYENRVLGAFRVTQVGQGSLDGRWHVLGSDGVALYTLQITDPGAGEERIEGAWRNLKVTGPGGSGFIEGVRREGDEVVFAFRDGPDQQPAQLRLRQEANGGWSGMTIFGETRVGVLANRAQGLETASMAVPEWRNPPPPARPKRQTRSRRKR